MQQFFILYQSGIALFLTYCYYYGRSKYACFSNGQLRNLASYIYVQGLLSLLQKGSAASLNAAQYSLSAYRNITFGLFGQALYNVVFGNNMKSSAFVLT